MAESLSSLTLLVGDPFLCEEKFQSLVKQIKKEASGDISLSKYRVTEQPLDSLLGQAKSLPFLVTAQVFRITDVHLLKSSDHDEALDRFFSQSTSSSSYFVFEADTLPKTHKIVKLAQKYGQIFEFTEKQRQGAGAKFVQQKLRQFDKSIQPNALRKLMQHLQSVPVLLDSAVEQLIAYSGSQQEISEAMVDMFEEKWQETDVYQLTNAVNDQDTKTALSLFNRILSEGTSDVYQLMGLMHWQLRRFLIAKIKVDQGRSMNDAMRDVGVSTKQSHFFLKQMNRLDRQVLENKIEGLFRLDWQIKQGEVLPTTGFETWLAK